MLNRIRAWWVNLIVRAGEKERDRLLAEGQRLKAEVLKANGGKPLRITAATRRKLDELSKSLDPEWVKQHSLFVDAEVVEDEAE